jgi:hypothetical protein
VARSTPLALADGAALSDIRVALPASMRERLRRVSAAQLLGGRSPLTSLDELGGVLEPGREIILWDERGQKVRGRVGSISLGGVAIYPERSISSYGIWGRERSFARSQRRTFPATAVTRIDVADSTWNGYAWGTAAGVASVVMIGSLASGDCGEGCPGLAIFAAPMLAATLPFIGGAIDEAINAPLYERPGAAKRLSIRPAFDLRGVAVSVSIRLGSPHP